MKSIKLATGFAVSALALAIAGQATANSHQTSALSFSGDLKVQTILDLENSQISNVQPGLLTGSEDNYVLDARWAFRNGPFSGRLRAGMFGHTAGVNGRSTANLVVDSLRVTEGPIQFGQVARVTATASLYESLTKENDLFQVKNASGNATGDETTRFDVDFGLRYTLSEIGAVLQLESHRRIEGIFGIAGSITQDFDVAKLWVDGQYRIANDSTSGMASDNAAYNAGVALQVQPVEQVTLTGVYRLVTKAPGRNLTAPTGTATAVYAAKLDLQATDEVSIFALVTDRDANDAGNSTVLRTGVTASVAPYVVEAGYEANLADVSEGEFFTSATWTDGPLSAFIGVDYTIAATNTYKLSLGGDITSGSGIVYGTEYTFEDNKTNKIDLFASYSF